MLSKYSTCIFQIYITHLLYKSLFKSHLQLLKLQGQSRDLICKSVDCPCLKHPASRGPDHYRGFGIFSLRRVWDRKKLSKFTVLLTVLLKTQAISGDRFEEQLVSWLDTMQSWNFTEMLWLPFGGACLYPLTTRGTKSLASWLGLARRGAWWWMLW